MKHIASITVLGQYITVTLANADLIVKIISGSIVAVYYLRRWYLMEKRR